MKKIITVATMAAMVAGAAFAAEASATVQAKGSLFTISEGKDPTALSLEDVRGNDTAVEFKVEGEKAGASVKIKNGSADVKTTKVTVPSGVANDPATEEDESKITIEVPTSTTVTVFDDASIWIKPVDQVKLSLGGIGGKLAEDVAKLEGKGYGLTLSVDPLTVELGFGAASFGDWFNGNKVGVTTAKVAYKADFGTVTGFFGYNGQAAATDNNVKFGAQFSGSADAISYDVAVGGAANTEASSDQFKLVEAAVVVKYAADPLTVTGKVLPKINVGEEDTNKLVDLKLNAKVEYALEDFTGYAEVTADDVLADTFKLTVNPGVKGKIDSAEWDVGVKFELNPEANVDYKVSVPVSLKLAF